MSEPRRPEPGEHAEFYGSYIDLVPDGDVVETLTRQFGDTLALLQEVAPDREAHRYAPDKWTIREAVGHLLDTERVMAFRALAMARRPGIVLPGMDPDEWTAGSNAARRTLDDLAAEWAGVRRANVHFFGTLDPEAWGRTGVASGNPFTVRCFPWIIAGHELWHRQILAEKYLGMVE